MKLLLFCFATLTENYLHCENEKKEFSRLRVVRKHAILHFIVKKTHRVTLTQHTRKTSNEIFYLLHTQIDSRTTNSISI